MRRWNRVRLGLAAWLRTLADRLDPPPPPPTKPDWGTGDPLSPDDLGPLARPRRDDD